jgi:hypothetical protein
MSLFNRLTNEDLAAGETRIPLHAFCSCLHEYARGRLTPQQIATALSIPAGDTDATAVIGLIDAQSTVLNKLGKAMEINDVLIIHEHAETNSLYPTKSSVATRLIG